MRHIADASGAPRPIGAYSQAVVANGLIFCAGQIGIDPATGELVASDDVKEQARQVLENLSAVVDEAGSDFTHVLQTTVFITDPSHGPVVNSVYASFVHPERPPARQTVTVAGLPMGALVEISVIAAEAI